MFVRWTRLLACLSLLLLMAMPAMPVHGQMGIAMSRYFPETGRTVRGGFLEFFDLRGSVGVYGYPITEEFVENGITVQYFEKARLEWHPEAPAPHQIQLGRLGFLLHGSIDPPVPDTIPAGANARYIVQTGHIVSGPFLTFFDSCGGPSILGNPITEMLVSGSTTIQYFERARLEADQSNPGVVRLGNVGAEWLTKYPFHAYALPSEVPSKYFPDTGQFVRSAFLEFYETHGGKDLFGEPISPVYTDDDGVPVQYFQRARFEFRPELAPGFQVTLGKLGREIHGPAEPGAGNSITPWDPNKRYFPSTGHIVSNAFLAFFDTHGKETMLGQPLGEAEIVNGVISQYFEKVRLEWHPENPPPYQVQIGLLGVERYHDVGPARNGPSYWFAKLWTDQPSVAQRVGKAMEDVTTLEMTEQYFEGGFLLTWKGTNRIYVIYEGGAWDSFVNTYRAGDVFSRDFPEPIDKFEPTGAFGKIWWGLGGPGCKLGWAVEEPRDFIGHYQQMEHGFMLRILRPVEDPDNKIENDQKWIYVIYNDYRWEIYEDMFDKSFTVRPPDLLGLPTPDP